MAMFAMTRWGKLITDVDFIESELIEFSDASELPAATMVMAMRVAPGDALVPLRAESMADFAMRYACCEHEHAESMQESENAEVGDGERANADADADGERANADADGVRANADADADGVHENADADGVRANANADENADAMAYLCI